MDLKHQRMKKASGDETLTEFSLEAIKDKLSNGCELWAVRLPYGLNKLRYLNDIKITLPDHADASTSASSEKIADFQHKKSDYEIYSLTDNTQDVSDIGAGEMRNMTALLANKRKKYSAVPIQRHIVIKQAISFPPENRPEGGDEESGHVKHQQPEGLDGFFAPAGYHSDLNKARSKRPRLDDGDLDAPLPPPLAATSAAKATIPAASSQAVDDSIADVSMSQDTTMSKEERKRLKKEKKERKEEKRKRKSEAAAAAGAAAGSA
ncbi:hypothetical protein P389DRAFT_97249 [Cystobasidium minutum MCA 4210]|uniref:uncharacterized protein n=1 Tax=Cystobasidium minutum MCA 4210 TaxID=1397322 RepID=UPI0034CD4E60|eukprot:jgi/Rhomi1/97249/CE97248_1587